MCDNNDDVSGIMSILQEPIIILYLFLIFITMVTVYAGMRNAEDDRQRRIEHDIAMDEKRIKEYEENHNAPERDIFRKRSENFVDKVDENSLDIVIEVSAQHLKKAHTGITNYLSNVGGKLDDTTENPLRNDGMCMYFLKVPQGAKFAENLEEELDKYLHYDDVMETDNNGEIKSE